MEYLGFQVTRDGVKPINKNIKAMANTNPPTSQKEVKTFIGVVNYYHDIWPRRSHTLGPLTKIVSNKRKFVQKKL